MGAGLISRLPRKVAKICLKISPGTLYFWFRESAQNSRSDGAAGNVDTSNIVVFDRECRLAGQKRRLLRHSII
jgi:hypothetical protein